MIAWSILDLFISLFKMNATWYSLHNRAGIGLISVRITWGTHRLISSTPFRMASLPASLIANKVLIGQEQRNGSQYGGGEGWWGGGGVGLTSAEANN